MEVIWDNEKIYVDLPIASMTLGSLKSYLSSKTGVLPQHMKLFSDGGLMKDDMAPLSAYQNTSTEDHPSERTSRSSSFWSDMLAGVRKARKPLMRLRMVGSPETRAFVSDRPDLRSPPPPPPSAPSNLQPHFAPAPTSAPPPIDELTLASKIRDLTNQTLQNTSPQVDQLELGLTSGSETVLGSSSTSNHQTILNQFAGLSEMLLQTLLKLDGFEIEVEWTEARAARKDGVRAVQALLDRLDDAKSKYKTLHS